jgi:hypothetical protein
VDIRHQSFVKALAHPGSVGDATHAQSVLAQHEVIVPHRSLLTNVVRHDPETHDGTCGKVWSPMLRSRLGHLGLPVVVFVQIGHSM